MNQQKASQLTKSDWSTIGAFALLLIGVSFLNPQLAAYIGVGAIAIIALKGWSLG